MQIAIRDDQPRFDASGQSRAGKPATGHPFDELVRAMGARESRTDAGRDAYRDTPERERPEAARDYSDRDATDRRRVDGANRRGSDNRRPDEPVSQPTVQSAETPAPAQAPVEPDAPIAAAPAADPAQAQTQPAAQDQTAPDQTAPDQTAPDQTAPDQATPDQATPDQAAAADLVPAATQQAAAPVADAEAMPVDDDILAHLMAVMQSRGPVNGTGPGTAGPQASGLAVALFAHSLVATQQAPGLQTAMAPGERVMAGNAPAKMLGKQSQPGLGKEQGAAADFSAVAAALASNPAGGRGAAATAAAAGGLPPVSEGASAPPAPTGSGTPPGAATLGERAAQTARADGPTQAQPMPRLNGPQFAERIGLTIARAAETGVDRVSIRLNPRELGRIDVRMELGQDGRMTMTVAADRQETLDQLQRNVRDLERALADAGFDTSAGDLSFSLRQQSPGDQDDTKRSGRDAGSESEPDGGEAVDGMIITHQSDSHLVVDLYV